MAKKMLAPVVAKTSSSNWRLFSLAAAIILITFFSFSPARNNDFINQDDDIYVYNNSDLAKPFPEAIGYFFGPHYFSGNYIPLTMIGYAIAYHTAATAPEFYHTINILFHLGNVLLVFWFVYLLSGRKAVVAAIVALFFGIHPMHVESVAWVSEFKDVLYTFSFVAGLIAYYKYYEWTQKKTAQPDINAKAGGQRKVLKNGYLLLTCFLFFIFSVLSKPAAIIFPVVILLIDFYTHRKYDRMAWVEKLPFFAVSVIFGVIAIKAQYADDLVSHQYPFVQRLFFASYALMGYLAKFVLPIHLSNFYPYPLDAAGHPSYFVYFCPAIIILVAFGVYKTLKYSRLVAFGFLFFLANTILMLQIVSVGNAVMADRYTYVSYTGLIFILAMGFDRLYNGSERKLNISKPAAAGIVFVIAMVCSVLTYARCKVWENKDTMSIDLLDNFPNDPIVLNNRGYILFREGDYAEAIKLFRGAVALRPNYIKSDYVKAYVNLADCYLAMKNEEEAEKVIYEALRYAPHNHNVLNKMGCIFAMHGQQPAALKMFKEAVFYKKDDIDVYVNMAHCYYDLHDYDSWVKAIDTGLKYAPDNYFLLNNKGYSLFLKGDYNNAITYFKAVLEIKPDFEIARANLSNCYRALNDSLKSKTNEYVPGR